ncbi:phosphatidate cytidylyltransferase [bacterium]|nr:phosphatidate cytidylyltransferase [bacterium]
MMKQRIKYGYPLGTIAIAILAYGNTLLFISLCIFATYLLIEFYQLTGLRSDRRLFPMRRWGYILGLIILSLVYLNLTNYFDFAIAFFIVGAMIYRMANFHSRSDAFLHDLAVSILGGIYIGGFLSYFLRLRILGIALKNADIIPTGSGWLATIPLLGNVLENAGWTSGLGQAMAMGPNWLVLLPILGSWGYDFSAIFTGVLLGKTPLAPAISPKKTIEGMAGGVIGCGVSIVVLSIIIGISSKYYLFLFVIGLVMGTFSQLGDLCVSSIKREAGVKDSYHRIIPGHGGLLDKCDGLLFVLPVCYYLIYFAMMIAGIPTS